MQPVLRDETLHPTALTTPAPQTAPAPTPASWRQRLRSWLPQLGLALALLLSFHWWQTRHVPSGPAPDFTAPAVSVQPDAQLSLAQWRAAHPGQPVALHFWAEWCGICRLEEGNVSRVAADWPVLTVAMRSGPVPQVRQTLSQRGLNWPTVVDTDAQIARHYGLRAVPALVVITPDGRIASASVGYTSTWGMRLRLWWASNMR